MLQIPVQTTEDLTALASVSSLFIRDSHLPCSPLLPSNPVCLPALHCWIRSGSILLTHPDLPTVLQFDCCSGHTLKSHSLFILHPSIVETAGIVRMSQRGFPPSAACLTKTRLLFGLLWLALPHSSVFHSLNEVWTHSIQFCRYFGRLNCDQNCALSFDLKVFRDC